MTIVIVEGESDRIAVEVLALRLNYPPPRVVAIGGAHAVANVAAGIREQAPHEYLVGLVDIGEREAFDVLVDEVFACDRDLEDELIRGIGIDRALGVIEEQGELRSFRLLQKQPAQRDQDLTDQLRRFLSGRSGNKARYAALFSEAIQLNRIPAPLRAVLAATTSR